jgi:hypothetical protein
VSEPKKLKQTGLIPFGKGYDPRRYVGEGAPKKWATVQKELQYTKEEVLATFRAIMVRPIEELRRLAADQTHSTGLEALVAKSFVTDYDKGSMYRTDSIMDRLWGKATEHKDETINLNVTSLKVEVIKVEAKIARNEKELDV